jgi:hypothetical protein
VQYRPSLSTALIPQLQLRHAVAQLVEALRYKPEVAGSIPDDVIEIFR